MSVDIEEVRRWFGDGWEWNAQLREAYRGRASITGCDDGVAMFFGSFAAFDAPTISALAAKVRAWHVEQARSISLELEERGD